MKGFRSVFVFYRLFLGCTIRSTVCGKNNGSYFCGGILVSEVVKYGPVVTDCGHTRLRISPRVSPWKYWVLGMQLLPLLGVLASTILKVDRASSWKLKIKSLAVVLTVTVLQPYIAPKTRPV